nr:AAA domain-containing protein [Pseudomonas aeruginosa]
MTNHQTNTRIRDRANTQRYQHFGHQWTSNRTQERKQRNKHWHIKTLPVQGPPGVGKTHLVTTLVKQIFEKEPDSRVLLSAQSHATVQHLYHEIEKTELSSSKSDTLIIRCSKQDNDDDSALSDADAKAKDFLEKLISSKLFENSTSHRLKTRILEMSQGHRRVRLSEAI